MKITRQWLFENARLEAEKHFDAKKLLCLIPRETAWYAITLLESELQKDVVQANKILEQIVVTDGTHSPCTLFVILHRYSALLSEEAKVNILKNLKTNLPISAMVKFTDGNVNHPVAAFVNLICSGELFEQSAYIELGANSLIQFHLTISSRRHKHFGQAEMSEYNSPTYTALTLWFLSVAAEFAHHRQAREIALSLEQHLWIAVAMHWHEPSHQFAGPFSRAYAEDSLGGFSALHCTFGYAMEKEIFIADELAKKYEHPSALIENSFLASLKFHVPDDAKIIAFEKPFPYYFRKTTYCEQYHENAIRCQNNQAVSCFDDEIYPGGWGDLTSYLTQECCLGTASRPYVNAGHSDAFSLRYRRAEKINNLADFRGAYSRMVFNGAVVGQDNFCHVAGFNVNKDYLYEEGRAFTYQHKNNVIVCYAPKRAGHLSVTEIRLDLIFSYYAPFDGFYVNGKRIEKYPEHFKKIDQIVIEDYNTFLAILPLPQTFLNNFQAQHKIWIKDNHFIISFFNYQGKKINFTRDQMSQTRNGFILIAESMDNFSSCNEFQKYLQNVKVEEVVIEPFIRDIKFSIDKYQMCFKIDPISERILERSWNKKDDSPYHLEIDAAGRKNGMFCPKSIYGIDE